jgi:hypothetical protein
MSLGRGYSLKAGVGKETTWGTLVAPAEFVPIIPGESVKDTAELSEQEVLKSRAGREISELTGIKVGGSISFEANYQETDLLWALLFGGTCSVSGSNPYVHTVLLGEDITRSLSLHLEKMVNVWSISGVKINTASFSISADSPVGVFSLDGITAKSVEHSTTHRTALTNLADPGKPRILWHHSVVRIGNLSGALGSSHIQEVNSIEISINNNLAIDQRDATTGLYVVEPLRSGRREITVNFNLPRYKADTLYGFYVAGTPIQMDIRFTRGIYYLLLEFPTLIVKEFTAAAGDAGIIPVSVSLQAYRNEGNTHMATITEECRLTIANDRTTQIW